MPEKQDEKRRKNIRFVDSAPIRHNPTNSDIPEEINSVWKTCAKPVENPKKSLDSVRKITANPNPLFKTLLIVWKSGFSAFFTLCVEPTKNAH